MEKVGKVLYNKFGGLDMEKNIIIINGTGGSGKDAFVKYVSKYCKIYNFDSVGKVKKIASIIGWDGKKTEKDRKFLSDLKKLTTEYNDMSFKEIQKGFKVFENSDALIMFIHIREPEEIKRAVDYFNAKSLLIKRRGMNNIESNYSDRNVDNYPYDFIVENNTLLDLEKEAKDFVKKLKL